MTNLTEEQQAIKARHEFCRRNNSIQYTDKVVNIPAHQDRATLLADLEAANKKVAELEATESDLNERVMVDVMGFYRAEPTDDNDFYDFWMDGNREIGWQWPKEWKEAEVILFKTDGNAMLMLLERMRGLGFLVIIYEKTGGDYRAGFMSKDYEREGYANAPTLPEALSLAAIEAVGVTG